MDSLRITPSSPGWWQCKADVRAKSQAAAHGLSTEYWGIAVMLARATVIRRRRDRVVSADWTARFDRPVPGFAVATDQPFDDDQRWIELRIPGAQTRLVLFTPKGQEDRIGSFSNIAFVADDVENTYRELVERGVEFVREPEKADWGTAAVFHDPDGNSFVISSK